MLVKGGNLMSVFSERVTELMRGKDLSQKEFANIAGVTASAMSYYVNGSRVPHGEVLVRMAKALDTTTDYLLGASEEKKDEGSELHYLQRNLEKLNPDQLKKAEDILKTVFDDIFENKKEGGQDG